MLFKTTNIQWRGTISSISCGLRPFMRRSSNRRICVLLLCSLALRKSIPRARVCRDGDAESEYSTVADDGMGTRTARFYLKPPISVAGPCLASFRRCCRRIMMGPKWKVREPARMPPTKHDTRSRRRRLCCPANEEWMFVRIVVYYRVVIIVLNNNNIGNNGNNISEYIFTDFPSQASTNKIIKMSTIRDVLMLMTEWSVKWDGKWVVVVVLLESWAKVIHQYRA